MLSGLNNLPQPDSHLERFTALLVSGDAADVMACGALAAAGLRASHVATVGAARDHLFMHAPALVLCERTLPDGDWLDVLAACRRLEAEPRLLVLERNADEALWCEVLAAGGFDVLRKPLDRSDLLTAIQQAGRHWFGQVTGLSQPGAAAVRSS